MPNGRPLIQIKLNLARNRTVESDGREPVAGDKS